MVGKSQIKLIKSLRQKKYREEHGLFIAEGRKCVTELLDSNLKCEAVYADDFGIMKQIAFDCTPVGAAQLKQMSNLKTPAGVLGVFEIPSEIKPLASGIALALDDVRDPGNLGTIIRLCDWFGIPQLVCSVTTADCYNPKVVQATMGSLSRVRISYVDLPQFLANDKRPVWVADMDGENVYESTLPGEFILVMGNEANGISAEVGRLASGILSIPRFGALHKTESLNVATATAVLLSEYRRHHP
ncbi:TrmH family RNA methyltransferase [Robertkochia flava]|uniref:TrmH family RNA methyltransferase n=1 Tax=Robertkochia flava TaxID=3447986 RepID=UPI001CC98603|nr:RNA methyltransferase [Robertkochia marina]